MLRSLLLCCLLCPVLAPAAGPRTPETLALQQWLARPAPVPALGAQWNGGSKSIGWREQADILGREPLLFGIEYYDDGPIERHPDARDTAQRYIEAKFRAGGVITVNDHMPNLVTGGNAWDRRGGALAAILPGGAAHGEYLAYLDRMAAFFARLRVDGLAVPILFRPFHEMNGTWFWWGDAHDGDALVRLWRFTHDYLHEVRGLRNLLWVWSPNIASNRDHAHFLAYWPGARYVDVVALDGYDNRERADFASPAFRASFDAVARIAREAGLPLAFSELGFRRAAQALPGFWTAHFLPPLRTHYMPVSYVLIWNYEFGPRAGTPAAESFRELAERKTWLLQGDVAGTQIYGTGFAEVR